MTTLPIDPTIAALADQANAWLMMMSFFAGLRSTPEKPFTLPDLLAECMLTEQATSCGYLATASRGRSVRHAAYSGGAVRAPKRVKPMTDGEKFGLFSRVTVQPCGNLWEGLRDGVVVCRDYTADGAWSGARLAVA
jgi:hypothetical protein